MINDKPNMMPVPEPYHLIIPQSLYKSIKYNQAHHHQAKGEITNEEATEFKKFKDLFKNFMNKLNAQDPSAFSTLSAIMGMWGYSRKYCGMCGRPIIGKPGHIQNRMVCPTCDDSYKIAEELHKREDSEIVNEKRTKGFYNKETTYKIKPKEDQK
jgi:hypothetical protein